MTRTRAGCTRKLDKVGLRVSCYKGPLGGHLTKNCKYIVNSENHGTKCRSQWPHGLRRRSTAARLLRLWV